MVKNLIVLLLLLSNISFAQNGPAPTQFDKFVNKPNIEWAAYASDTFNFTKADLNNLLLTRIEKNEIKASLPVESRTGRADQIKYTIKDSIDNAFYGDNVDYMMDSMGNEVSIKKPIPKKDTSNFKITEVTQILYIENGTLKSYIPFITLMLPVYMSTGNYIGESFYFTTSFNYKYNNKPRKKNKLIFLGQTKKMLKLNPVQNTNQLKEMYGRNLLQTIWPSVLNNKINAFSLDNRKLKPEELDITLAYSEPVLAPIYDSVGTVISYLVTSNPIDIRRFTDVQLVQDWYYDYRNNKVYSYIKEMVLILSKFDKKEEKDPVPVLRLVFK